MIRIEIRDAARLRAGPKSAFVTFPYKVEIVNVVRSLPIKFWDANSKEWEIPVSQISYIRDKLPGINISVKGEGEEKPPQVYDLPEQLKATLMNHQLEAYQYGMNNDRWILGDEPGLGKSLEIITIALGKYEEGKHCLVICGVNSIKWNWRDEIKIHAGMPSTILGERTTRTGRRVIKSNKDKLADLQDPQDYFLITNVESIRDEAILTQLKFLCDTGKIHMIAFDEFHVCVNPSTQQGKNIQKLQTSYMIGATGTPLMNSPLDLYLALKWLGYETHSYYSFKNHYAVMGGFGGYQIVNYKNLPELQARLANCMLRRRKDDVLDLPEKIIKKEYVEMGTKQWGIYNEVLDTLKKNIDKVKLMPDPLAALIRLRQATATTSILSTTVDESAKFDRLEEILIEAVANNQKIIVFSNWSSVIDEVFERFEKYNPAIITGDIVDRQAEKNYFMLNPECKLIVGTIGAMGTGLTLTAASIVVFLDLPWNAALFDQCCDRAHRIGTKSAVLIYIMMCKDTIDEKLLKIVTRKRLTSDALVDGEYDLGSDEVIGWILGVGEIGD